MDWKEVGYWLPPSWIFGDGELGCCVHVNCDGKWEIDVVIYNICYRLLPEDSLEEAKVNAEVHFYKLYEEYHEENN